MWPSLTCRRSVRLWGPTAHWSELRRTRSASTGDSPLLLQPANIFWVIADNIFGALVLTIHGCPPNCVSSPPTILKLLAYTSPHSAIACLDDCLWKYIGYWQNNFHMIWSFCLLMFTCSQWRKDREMKVSSTDIRNIRRKCWIIWIQHFIIMDQQNINKADWKVTGRNSSW